MKITAILTSKNRDDIETLIEYLPTDFICSNAYRAGWFFNRRWEARVSRYLGPKVVVKTDKPVEEV